MTETYEQLLENNKEKIYRICKIYAVSPLEPQDLFQEVIFAIWKSNRYKTVYFHINFIVLKKVNYTCSTLFMIFNVF